MLVTKFGSFSDLVPEYGTAKEKKVTSKRMEVSLRIVLIYNDSQLIQLVIVKENLFLLCCLPRTVSLPDDTHSDVLHKTMFLSVGKAWNEGD